MHLKSLSTLSVQNKVVLLRIDLNVPRHNGIITDYTRIERSLPTIKYLIQAQAKLIIISHIGKPNGCINLELSLQPLVQELSRYLGKEVYFCPEIIGTSVKRAIDQLNYGDVLLLENIRFNPGEENNDESFTEKLSSLGDMYVNDAFSCAHRKHSSIYGLATKLPSAAGFLLENELNSITKLVNLNHRPFTVIIGGSKVSSKLTLLMHLVSKADFLMIGGAMANTFLAAQKLNIGMSLYEPNLLSEASSILDYARTQNCKIILPRDSITLNLSNKIQLTSINNISTQEKIMDIGPETIQEMNSIIQSSKLVVWNGPLGAFELEPFSVGSTSITKSIVENTTNNGLCSVAGGGDTLAAIKLTNLSSKFSYISTGGGAFLEWLKGKNLPGVQVLKY